MESLKTRKEASKILGVHYHTLYRMAERKEIEVVKVGNRQLYNVDKYLKEKKITKIGGTRRKVCYCRVSSKKQKEDLYRQIELMKELYPTHDIISDIGSGLNMKREGLKNILDYAIEGEIEEVVITYKDRLMRFGYELVEHIINKYSEGKIIIINATEEKTVTEEISEDLMAIMNVYVAKINGLRRHKKMIKEELK
jgi:excisionase family DNA binding protein